MYQPKMDMSDSPQSDPRNVVIVGPGAMGCLHAGLLGRMPHLDVVLLDHRADRGELINEQGVIIEAPAGTYTVSVPCTADAQELSIADLVIIFTKAYDTAAAAEHCAPVVGPATAILTLQNGLGNYQTLQQNLPDEQVLAGTTSSGATLLDVGQVRQAGLGQIALGSPTGNQALTKHVVELFKSAGLQVEMTGDVDALLWRKVL
ncbi:MAG: ketopantoate reductase family protein, partial [Armatimonadetes bacterium]|nr:ketopantoate reductase family protein [Armatimonadota bacterium]